MYSLQYEYYRLLQIIVPKILMNIIWSQLFFYIVHDLFFPLKIWIVLHSDYLT